MTTLVVCGTGKRLDAIAAGHDVPANYHLGALSDDDDDDDGAWSDEEGGGLAVAPLHGGLDVSDDDDEDAWGYSD